MRGSVPVRRREYLLLGPWTPRRRWRGDPLAIVADVFRGAPAGSLGAASRKRGDWRALSRPLGPRDRARTGGVGCLVLPDPRRGARGAGARGAGGGVTWRGGSRTSFNSPP